MLSEPRPPVDLKQIAVENGYRFVVDTWRRADPSQEDDWCVRVVCKRGEILVRNDKELRAITSARMCFHRLKTIPEVKVIEQTPQRLEVAFKPSLIHIAATILKVRRVPRAEVRAALAATADQAGEA